jgi:hypothetical protein
MVVEQRARPRDEAVTERVETSAARAGAEPSPGCHRCGGLDKLDQRWHGALDRLDQRRPLWSAAMRRLLLALVLALAATVLADAPVAADVTAATLGVKHQPRVTGVARYTHTLVAAPGRYTAKPSKIRYQWLRGDDAIAGATGRRYEIRPEDVGARLRVQLTVLAPGYDPLEVRTRPTPTVRHRVDVRRTVRYHVETRGRITTSVKQFRAQAQQTYEDPRGWRAAGIRFVPVAHGGAFTLVLSQASLLPSFSSQCSVMWSCRVGRFVIINQDRWKNASPAWNAAHLPLRDYRHMVVNHETGHWLGLHHVSCPGKGRLAPVMMQQSKGLHGCRFNPFPTIHELNSRTPPARAMAMLEAESYSPGVE